MQPTNIKGVIMRKESLALSILCLLSACGGGGSEGEESKAAVEPPHCSVNNIYTRTNVQGFDSYNFSVNECNNLVSLKERINGTRPSNLSNVISIDVNGDRYESSRSGSSYHTKAYIKDEPEIRTYVYKIDAADIPVTYKLYASFEYETVVHEESYYTYPDQTEYQKVKVYSDPNFILEQLLDAIKEAPIP
jgi:hypothetical protein